MQLRLQKHNVRDVIRPFLGSGSQATTGCFFLHNNNQGLVQILIWTIIHFFVFVLQIVKVHVFVFYPKMYIWTQRW